MPAISLNPPSWRFLGTQCADKKKESLTPESPQTRRRIPPSLRIQLLEFARSDPKPELLHWTATATYLDVTRTGEHMRTCLCVTAQDRQLPTMQRRNHQWQVFTKSLSSVMTPCSPVIGCKIFRSTYCLLLQGNNDLGTSIRNASTHLPIYTLSKNESQ